MPTKPLGHSILIKGELTAREDLSVHGRVEGKISLPEHTLTIGPQARIDADVSAKVVVVQGKVVGKVHATERLDLEAGGVLEGELTTPRLKVLEGAAVSGAVHMPVTPIKPA